MSEKQTMTSCTDAFDITAENLKSCIDAALNAIANPHIIEAYVKDVGVMALLSANLEFGGGYYGFRVLTDSRLKKNEMKFGYSDGTFKVIKIV